jgi:hypothetical protein
VEAIASEDRAAIACLGARPGDELADVVYLAYGTAHAYAIDLDVALAEVHRANLQKANGPRRADGKAMKPEGFVPPDMSGARVNTLLICPWFGPLPPWWKHYVDNIERLRFADHGYHWLIDTDLESFKQRCLNTLGIEFPGVEGGSKIHDWRPTLGRLYEKELANYDFWGHTDFDCVYGRVWEWLTPEVLDGLDVHSNHLTYICGPWTIYRNTPMTRDAFVAVDDWQEQLRRPETSGWAEGTFTAAVNELPLRVKYSYWQTKSLTNLSRVHWDGERLMDGGDEIFHCHFRRSKVYPAGLLR